MMSLHQKKSRIQWQHVFCILRFINNFHDQIDFEQNPIRFMQDLIDDRQKEIPLDLEDKIKKKYFIGLEKQIEQKMKISLMYLQEADQIGFINDDNEFEIRKCIQDCLESMFAQGQKHQELLEIFFLYQKLKVPDLNIQKPISREDKIKQDFQEVQNMLPSIGRKFSIQDFMKVQSQSQIDNERIEMVQQFKLENKIQGSQLINLLFNCIKSRSNFNQIISIFSNEKSDFKITKTLLFVYIYIHSDQKLKTMLFTSCSQYMPVPMMAFNPWDNDEDYLMPRRIFFPEIVYAFEKQRSILQVKILENFQNMNVKNCSTIINQLFKKQFQTHQISNINDGTIEIQFDYNCSQVQYLAVADAHGFLEEDLMGKIANLFDFIIVHTNQELSKNKKLNDFIAKVNQNQKIMIIVHQNNSNDQFKFVPENKLVNVHQLKIPLFENIHENNRINFYNCCYEFFDEIFNNKNHEYISKPLERLQSRYQILSTLKEIQNHEINKTSVEEFYDNQNDQIDLHKQTIDLTNELIKKIYENQENLNSENFMPMMNYAKQKNNYQRILLMESDLTDDLRKQYRYKNQQITEEMSKQIGSEIINTFQQVINQDNQLEIMPIFTKIVKGYLEVKKDPMEIKINDLISKIQQTDDNDQKQIYQKIIGDLKNHLDIYNFSQEMIIREIYYLSQYSSQKQTYDQVMKQLSFQLLNNGQPLELIDGDTLQFISNIYENIYQKNDKEEILVVSVIGVQSSGKSLLLNFLFGTQFHSSAGRCTKGVYTSILTYECPKSNRKKKILLLDTEGIQSPDARDEIFDRKIVYYILSISHVVLLCNKQEMNKNMSDILNLVAHELEIVKQQTIQSPDIYLIPNMLVQLDAKIEFQSVNNLKYIVFKLPQAFEVQSFGPNEQSKLNNVNIPQQEFINRIQKLREMILKKFDDIDDNKTQKMTFCDWFKFAEHIWQYTQQNKILESFKNLDQLQQDLKISKIVNQLVEKYFEESWKQELKVQIDKILQDTLKGKAGGLSIHFDIELRNIKTEVDKLFENKFQMFINEYFTQCNQDQIQTQQYKSEAKIEMLQKKKYHYLKKAESYFAKELQIFIQGKTQNVGDSTLQQIIIQLLRQQNSFSKKEAEQKFEEAWKEVLQKSYDVLADKDELKKRIQKQVQNEFQQIQVQHEQDQSNKQIQPIRFTNADKEIFCIDEYQLQSNLQSLFYKTQKIYKDQKLVLFEGNKKKPNYKKVMDFYQKDVKYLNKFPQQIFQEHQIFEYYDWRKAIDEILNIDRLSFDIRMAVIEEKDFKNMNQAQKFCDNMINQLENALEKLNLTFEKIARSEKNQKKVHDIIVKLKNNLLILGIQCNENSSCFIPSSDKEKLQRKLGVKNTQYIILNHIESMIHENKFLPLCLPQINSYKQIQQQGQLIKPSYEYLDFKENYSINQYIKDSPVKINNNKNLFLNREAQNVKISKQMDAFIKDQIEYLSLPEGPLFQEDEQYFINSIYCFFDFLSETSKLREFDQKARESTTLFFQNILNWELIIDQIEECVVKNNQKNNNCFHKLSFYIEGLKNNNNHSVNILNQFHLLESKCTRGVINDVDKIIQRINEELDYFRFSLSEEGMYLIYLLAQTAQIVLCYNLELVESNQPIRILNERKFIQKNYFIGRLTMNNEMVDESLAYRLINDYSKQVYKDCQKFVVDEFNEQIDQISYQFQNLNQTKQLEQLCLNVMKKQQDNLFVHEDEQREINDYIQLIVDPKIIIEKKFNQKFQEECNQLIQQSIVQLKKRFIEFLEDFQIYLAKFQYDTIAKKIIDKNAGVLFQIHDDSPLKYDKIQENDLQKYQKQALTRYFLGMIGQTWNSNIIFKFQLNQVWLQKNPNYHLPIYTDLNKIEEEYQNLIQSIIKEDDEISNLYFFIDKAKGKIKEIINGVEISLDDGQIHQNNPQDSEANKYILSKQGLLGQSYQKLKQKFMGCKEHCPMCKKQCDVEHRDHEEIKDQKHECISGHQMQGFGGSKQFKNNYPILKSCDEIQNDDIIKYEGHDIKWENFKLYRFPNWVFDSQNTEEVKMNKDKNVLIWNLTGQRICEIYNQPPYNLEIRFQEASVIPKVHYVLMLDDSTSMKGNPWDDLIDAIREKFLSKIIADPILKQNSYISVINHNDTTITYFKESEPDLNLIDLIRFRGGKNDFDNPLIDAYFLCKNNPEKYDKFLLYFMSDGGSVFPQQGINIFLQDEEIIDKIEFHSIAYGPKANIKILQRMANSFPNRQGKMSQAPDAQALAQTFIDIVPNIYA